MIFDLDHYNSIYLEVDDYTEDEDGGEEIHEVGEVLPVEGLSQGPDLVLAGGEEVEQRDDGPLELGAAPGVDGGGGEGLPHDRLADVGRDEQGDAGAKTWDESEVSNTFIYFYVILYFQGGTAKMQKKCTPLTQNMGIWQSKGRYKNKSELLWILDLAPQ